jgi:hypothetical protein
VHVVGAVRRVVTEGFDAGEVLEPSALRVKKRSIDAEVVRIALDIGNGFLEGDNLFAQCEQEVLEAVRSLAGVRRVGARQCVVFYQRLRIARR